MQIPRRRPLPPPAGSSPGEGYWRLTRGRLLRSVPDERLSVPDLLCLHSILQRAPSFFRERRFGSETVWDDMSFRLPDLPPKARPAVEALSAPVEDYLDRARAANALPPAPAAAAALGGSSLASLSGGSLHDAALSAILPLPCGSRLFVFSGARGEDACCALEASPDASVSWRSGRLRASDRSGREPLSWRWPFSSLPPLPGRDAAALRGRDPRGRRFSVPLSALPPVHRDERFALPSGRSAIVVGFGYANSFEAKIEASSLLAIEGIGAILARLESASISASIPAAPVRISERNRRGI